MVFDPVPGKAKRTDGLTLTFRTMAWPVVQLSQQAARRVRT